MLVEAYMRGENTRLGFMSLVQETMTRLNARWDPEKDLLLAEYQRAHPELEVGQLCQNIQAKVLPHRSIKAIKSRRNLRLHKERARGRVWLPLLDLRVSDAAMAADRPRSRPSSGRGAENTCNSPSPL